MSCYFATGPGISEVCIRLSFGITPSTHWQQQYKIDSEGQQRPYFTCCFSLCLFTFNNPFGLSITNTSTHFTPNLSHTDTWSGSHRVSFCTPPKRCFCVCGISWTGNITVMWHVAVAMWKMSGKLLWILLCIMTPKHDVFLTLTKCFYCPSLAMSF